MKKILLLFATIAGFFGASLSQSHEGFVPSLKKLSATELQEIKRRIWKGLGEAELSSSKAKKYYKNLLNNRSKHLQEVFESGYVVKDDFLSPIVNSIISELSQNTIHKDDNYFRVYIALDNTVNATSWGNGIVLINVGLLERVKYKSELAFVLAHEMNHDIGNHMLKHLSEISEIATSKNLGTQFSRSGTTKDNRIGVLKAMYKYKRTNEFSSDIEGFKLASSSGYSTKGAYSLLDVLDNADYFVSSDSIKYSEVFSSSSFKFDNNWLKQKSYTSTWAVDEDDFIIPDEYKTHPEIKKRKSKLRNVESTLNENDSTVNVRVNQKFTAQAKFYSLEALMSFENFGFSLYSAIQHKNIYKEEPFLDFVILYSLFELASGIKDQTFTEKVSFRNQYQPEQYNQFLDFLHSLSSKKLIKLFNASYEKHKGIEGNIEYSEAIEICKIKLHEPDSDVTKLISEYRKRYPNSNLKF